ncbi:hypothetical protein COO58_15750 [Micromonospora sp. WMMA1996]|nr:hypothetical protein COO58_15750 [Micromonospora sp. WMMA1996]
MLPIALTCPVWWVARWAARMLASLAVVVACSLGATTLPAGVATAAPTPAGPAVGLTSRTPTDTPVAARPGRVDVAERPAPSTGVPEPAPRDAVARPGHREPVPAGRHPAPVGPRAPPAR